MTGLVLTCSLEDHLNDRHVTRNEIAVVQYYSSEIIGYIS